MAAQDGARIARSSTAVLAALIVLALLFHGELLPAQAAALLQDLRSEGKNRIDEGRMIQGYYQDLNQPETDDGGGLAQRLGAAIRQKPDALRGDRRFSECGATRKSETDFLSYELVPGVEAEHLGVAIKVNRWGQRDRDYEQHKPPGTFRIALIGASNSMGWGVRVEESFPELIEERLNRELAGRAFTHYELINFSVAGYSVVERLFVAEEIVPRFQPDLILMETTAQEIQFRLADQIAMRIQRNMDLRFGFLKSIVADTGLSFTDRPSRMQRRLAPAAQAIMREVYRYLGDMGRKHQTPIVLLILRLDADPRIHPLLSWSATTAEENGLIPLRIFHAFAGKERANIYLANETDHHPSAEGHALLADDIYAQLLSEPRTRTLLLPSSADGRRTSFPFPEGLSPFPVIWSAARRDLQAAHGMRGVASRRRDWRAE